MASLEEFLKVAEFSEYAVLLREFGIRSVADILSLTPEDWGQIKIPPFHRSKIIHGAVMQMKYDTKKMPSRESPLLNYTFTSNGPYCQADRVENLKTFEPQGYGVTNNSKPCFMSFAFRQPVWVKGVVIGNNVGVEGGWNSNYLEGVRVQVRTVDSDNYTTVHTIEGMPDTARSAYLAQIEQNGVVEVRLLKDDYFSTSYVGFV